MKLVTFVKSGEERLGLLAGDAVIDPLLASGDKAIFASALSLIKSGAAGDECRPRDRRQSSETGVAGAEGREARRGAPPGHHPVQRQQLQGPQRREGKHLD